RPTAHSGPQPTAVRLLHASPEALLQRECAPDPRSANGPRPEARVTAGAATGGASVAVFDCRRELRDGEGPSAAAAARLHSLCGGWVIHAGTFAVGNSRTRNASGHALGSPCLSG